MFGNLILQMIIIIIIISISFTSQKTQINMQNYSQILFPKLPFAEQILIWSARKWLQSNGRGSSLFETLRVAFRLARAPKAYLSLDAFLTILCSSSERAIEFNCPEAVNVTRDEMLFSSLITSLQLDENEDEAFDLISHWLPPAAQRCGLVHCNALAQELRVGGHVFTRCYSDLDETSEPQDQGAQLAPQLVENAIKLKTNL